MKKILGTTAATLVVLALIASFVVYPSMAASTARDQIITGVAAVAQASDVKISGVTVEVDGGNGISALAGGKKVGDISIRIARIELEEGATAGATPKLKAGDQAAAANGARDILDALEDVGSVELAIGEVVSGQDKLPLNYSSFKFSDAAWELSLKVPQKSVETLLKPLDVDFSATASGSDIKARFGFSDFPAKEFDITVLPTDGGRSITYVVDGEKSTEKVSDNDDVRLKKIAFSSAGSLYSITVGGTYDSASVRAQIEADLKKAEGKEGA